MIAWRANWFFKDSRSGSHGHYLFVKGTQVGNFVTLVNICAANLNQIAFVEFCLDDLAPFTKGVFIVSEKLQKMRQYLLEAKLPSLHPKSEAL